MSGAVSLPKPTEFLRELSGLSNSVAGPKSRRTLRIDDAQSAQSHNHQYVIMTDSRDRLVDGISAAAN